MRLHDFSRHEVPFSQLSTLISPAAESGQVARDLGYLPARQMTPSRHQPVNLQSVRFVHPPLPSHHPLPQRQRPDAAG